MLICLPHKLKMEEETIKVLYIDDESANLTSFKANFRFDFSILLAGSGQDALTMLETEQVHVIIADQRMPGMTGIELFERVAQKHPDPIRILLTGYTDVSTIIDSINKGNIYRYIQKPWNDHEIRVAIKNAYDIYSTRRNLFLKNKELQKINEELNRFIYSASHDLKAPILSIKGLLNVARLEGINRDPDKYFSMISNSINQLEIFIENIISYYKNVRVPSTYTEINFEKVLKETIKSYNNYYNAPSIEFITHIDAKETFITDEFRIRVIINNLLSNAIKYQKHAEEHKFIRVNVLVENKTATIEIEDNGIGIEEQDLNDIYKMFYRATTQNSGSGIGLYIVQEAVLKVNGEISVTSEKNKGTKFTVKIPNFRQPSIT